MKKTILGALTLTLFSCSPQENKKTSAPIYFDIEQYFNSEAARLQKLNPSITKEVLAKGQTENKTLKITDWKTELASFISSDINKSSWRGEFSETKSEHTTSYTTNNPNIPIKKIEIEKSHNQIKGIKIFKATENYLYTSTDTLFYYPDSLYGVQNLQNIKLLGQKKYRIIGKFR